MIMQLGGLRPGQRFRGSFGQAGWLLVATVLPPLVRGPARGPSAVVLTGRVKPDCAVLFQQVRRSACGGQEVRMWGARRVSLVGCQGWMGARSYRL